VKYAEYIRPMFYEIIGENEDAPFYITNLMALTWAQKALRDLVQASKCLDSRHVMSVVAGTSVYDLPDNCGQIWRVTFDEERIEAITQDKLRAHNHKWPERSGDPRFYYVGELNDQIGLYENPSTGSTYAQGAAPARGGIVDMSADPNVTPRRGFVVDRADASAPGPVPRGAIVDILTANGLEIFFKAHPTELGDHTDIDLPGWAKYGVLWGMLRDCYEAETELRNFGTALFYKFLYDDIKSRLKMRAADRLNREWQVQSFYARGAGKQILPRVPQHIEES